MGLILTWIKLVLAAGSDDRDSHMRKSFGLIDFDEEAGSMMSTVAKHLFAQVRFPCAAAAGLPLATQVTNLA
jgi:hypothetical protein